MSLDAVLGIRLRTIMQRESRDWRSERTGAVLHKLGLEAAARVASLLLAAAREHDVPLAFAMALIGLYLCVTGRDALGHILGFLVFENGIFGLAILATYGLPGIVEAGVFLDVLVIVLIMEAVVGQVRAEHESIEEERLRELRG